MAQRVYLVATSPELVVLLHEFLACDAWQEDDVWGRVRALAGPHTRAAGLAGPSWWLGRNYWIGRLAGAELAGDDEARLGPLQDLAIEASWNPSHLFEEVSPPGAEAGFSVTCPAYQTGLLFPQESCQTLLASLHAQRGMWTELGRLVAGYAVDEVIGLQQMVEEALEYGAQMEGFLLEGDEIVGEAGTR